jgi:hypothetical protein
MVSPEIRDFQKGFDPGAGTSPGNGNIGPGVQLHISLCRLLDDRKHGGGSLMARDSAKEQEGANPPDTIRKAKKLNQNFEFNIIIYLLFSCSYYGWLRFKT